MTVMENLAKIFPKNNYDNQDKVLLAVDCIIFGFDDDELKLLLIKRNFQPEKGKWSLMGGFLGMNETLNDAASRVLNNLTGLNDVYLEQLSVFSDLERDPVERTVSVAYFALINIKKNDKKLIRANSAQWFSLSEVPPLIFDHNEMVQKAIKQLRYKTSIQPIGFELLPDKFTMRQLQKLYEAILNQSIDKRNFSKKISQLDILLKLDEKDTISSKKGAYLYKFDEKKYRQKAANGFVFKL